MQYCKNIYPIVAMFIILMVSSCGDDLNEVREDGKVNVGVGVETNNVIEVSTRAASGYTDVTGNSYDGSTMGIFAVGETDTESGSAKYSSSASKWSSNLWLAPNKEYSFYAYMPYNISPASASMGTGSQLVISGQPPFSAKDLYVSVAAALNTATLTDGSYIANITTANKTVRFRMNHLLAKLAINFKLASSQYNELRKIEITSITLGSSVSNSKSYNITCNLGANPMTVTYQPAGTNASDVAYLEFPYAGDEKSIADGTTPAFQVTTDAKKYNDDLYIVPAVLNNKYAISMTITYNVYDRQSVTDDWVMTRQGATATNNNLVVYKNNTGVAAAISAGHEYTLNVNVVPSYLYQLADRDQSSIVLN